MRYFLEVREKKMKVMITKTVEIKLSGKDLADELWELDCQEQADFFQQKRIC